MAGKGGSQPKTDAPVKNTTGSRTSGGLVGKKNA